MKYISRAIEQKIIENLKPNKVVIIFGARRVGKTELIKRVTEKINEDYLLLNGEDVEHIMVLEQRSTSNYNRLLGDKNLLIIDEAQAVPEIGLKLKLMVDTIPNLKIIATGSSSFDLNNQIGEPLVGRKTEFSLFPLAQMEFSKEEDYLETKANLEERLIFGGYPELTHLPDRNRKIEYLKDQINAYLLKDIIAFEGIKKRDKIVQLLKIIAFRNGSEISIEGIGNQLQMSKNTIDRYLDLLSKVFIIHKVSGFSRNLGNEITKKSKWYFYDNGIRNAIISNFNPINLRDDIGQLWENYLISERLKYQSYKRMQINNYFWRTHTQKEIDWVEKRENKLSAFEFKWNESTKVKPPAVWQKAYPNAKFKVITPGNYLDFIV
jgi:predicted AAA+ superfamily ATPase